MQKDLPYLRYAAEAMLVMRDSKSNFACMVVCVFFFFFFWLIGGHDVRSCFRPILHSMQTILYAYLPQSICGLISR